MCTWTLQENGIHFGEYFAALRPRACSLWKRVTKRQRKEAKKTQRKKAMARRTISKSGKVSVSETYLDGLQLCIVHTHVARHALGVGLRSGGPALSDSAAYPKGYGRKISKLHQNILNGEPC